MKLSPRPHSGDNVDNTSTHAAALSFVCTARGPDKLNHVIWLVAWVAQIFLSEQLAQIWSAKCVFFKLYILVASIMVSLTLT